jgi:imidazolonepropionase
MLSCDTLLLNATTIDAFGQAHPSQALAIEEGRIHWCGPCAALPEDYHRHAKQIVDCSGKVVSPGLIDCHTHLVYAGSRANEFKERLAGATYAAIAKRGGGILSTVRLTRAASEEELFHQSLPRLKAMLAEGVTTVEIKSGYGLNLESELKMLRVAKRLGDVSGVRILKTFLGAHAVPLEYQGRAEDYVDYLCAEVLPAVAETGLVEAMDVFCETIAFSIAQTERLFLCAEALQLPIKCHAEQLSNMGASILATKYRALSCDHLEFLDAEGAKAMAKAGTIAVLLPGAYYFLKETQPPPLDCLRKAGVGIAIATDCNPGSSPTTSLPLMMSMACRFFAMTVPEVWQAVTSQAAIALGINQHVGTLSVGQYADLVCWEFNDSAELCYRFGQPFQHRTMIAGQWRSL